MSDEAKKEKKTSSDPIKVSGVTFLSLKNISPRYNLHIVKKYGNEKKTEAEWTKLLTKDGLIK